METLLTTKGTKEEKYILLLKQIKALIEKEYDTICAMANVAAMIQETFSFLWTGFYRVENETTLILGPFQGPIACTRIKKGKGVCGTAWEKDQTMIVPDVEKFPGHIACSSLSKSEIVIPLHNADNKIMGVLDIDSEELNTFDNTDAHYLEEIARCIPV